MAKRALGPRPMSFLGARATARIGLFLTTLALASGCGDDKKPKRQSSRDPQVPTQPGDNGGRTQGDSGTAGGAAAGGAGGAGGVAAAGGAMANAGNSATAGSLARAGSSAAAGTGSPGPAGAELSILEPPALTHPSAGEVLTETEVRVVCSVEVADAPDALAVDPSSVQIQVLDANSEPIGDPVATTLDEAGRYAVTVDIGTVEAGLIGFRCSAKSLEDPIETWSTQSQSYYDRGPEIEVLNPLPDSAHRLGSLAVTFEVRPVELADDDLAAAIDPQSVTLTIAGEELEPPVADEENPQLFQSTVDLTDATIFEKLPNGSTPVVIQAANDRGVVSTQSYEIIVDGDGPVITVESPRDQDLVQGEVALDFTIEDLSGVDEETIDVILNQDRNDYDPTTGNWSRDDESFQFRFDSRQFPSTNTEITVNIKAQDTLGNEGAAREITLKLDNQPPMISLDPPYVREWKTSGSRTYCSRAYDPVGVLAPNDPTFLLDTGRFRAIVWETTNTPLDPRATRYLAGVAQGTVGLYMRSDGAPLLIDTDGDGVCDDLDQEGAVLQQMSAVEPGGTPWYGPYDDPAEGFLDGTTDRDLQPPTLTDDCVADDAAAPKTFCDEDSDMYRVIKHFINPTTEEVIFAVGKTSAGPDCRGGFWNVLNANDNVGGWVCLAVRAEDNVGNIGVSPPLRACLNDEGCVDLAEPPSCSDGCQPPPSNEYLQSVFEFPVQW